MNDKLEDFIRDNRAQFDYKNPPERLWKNIARALGLGADKSWWNSVGVWRAAAILFLASTIVLLMPKNQLPRQQSVLNEFADVEQFYIQEISEKTALIEEFRRSEGLNGFTNDFKQLEAMYLVLREEMKTRPSAKVKDALVLNLLVRIDLLNQQLHKLETGEYSEPEKDTPVKEST
ncbi:MAG TPA: hypothetical protein VEB86_14675 [Chryseosolibacter sp.]|nr:hypothetical protein [Chryseosolibacter sp.]